MSEQTVQVESSATIPAIEVDRGPLVNWSPDERAEFRRTGMMPEPPKKEEAAPSKSEETPNSEAKPAKIEGATEPPKKQQENHRKPGAEQRIGQLNSENKRLKAELEALKSKPVAEPAKPAEEPKSAQPQNYQEWRKTFQPSKWIEEYAKANPNSSYEDANAAMADYLGDVRDRFKSFEQTQQTEAKNFQAKMDEAKGRYENFEDVVKPAVEAIVADKSVSPVVKQMLNDSELLPDLMFTIASSQEELASFIKMAQTNPGKAIRYIALTESLIQEELSKPNKAEEKTPAKTQTQAPKPPTEVGGRAAAPPDALESAAKANDFRSFKSEANRRAIARLKG